MEKNPIKEYPHEKKVRERAELVINKYLDYCKEITSGKVSPNRIMATIAEDEEIQLTIPGVKRILKTHGIYVDANKPLDLDKVQATYTVK